MTFQLVREKKYLFFLLGCEWYVMESAVCFGAYYLTVTGKSLKKLMPEKASWHCGGSRERLKYVKCKRKSQTKLSTFSIYLVNTQIIKHSCRNSCRIRSHEIRHKICKCQCPMHWAKHERKKGTLGAERVILLETLFTQRDTTLCKLSRNNIIFGIFSLDRKSVV